MTNLTIPRGAAVGIAALCTVLIAAGCDRSSDLTTPTIPPVSTEASTIPDTTAPTTPPTTAAPTTAAPTTAAPTTAPSGTNVTLAPVPDQHQAIQYDHPNLGPMTITIAYPPRTDTTLITATVRATVNATGEVVFEGVDDGGFYGYDFAGTEMNPQLTNPVDQRGHVFFEWSYGREPGVKFIVPTETGFVANGSIDDLHTDVYGLASVVDFDGDGNYEIDKGFQVCDPNCADGYYYTYNWTWDGSDYTGPNTDPGRDGGPDVIRLPGQPPEG